MAISTLTPAAGRVKYSRPLAGADKRPGSHPSGSQVKLYPGPNVAAFRAKAPNILGLYYCLRALDQPNGTGWIDETQGIQALIDIFHYRRGTLFKHLKQGEGLLWARTSTVWERRIEIYSLQRVVEYYSIRRKAAMRPTTIEVTQFMSVADRRAQIFANIPTTKPEGIKANPVYRETITTLTGLHKVQQRRYEQRTGVNRVAHFSMHGEVDDKGRISNLVPGTMVVQSKSKETIKQKRLGNSYYNNKAKQGNKGLVRKIKVSAIENSSLKSGEGVILRTYFKTFVELTRWLLKQLRGKVELVKIPAYRLVPCEKRIIPGRMEWLRYE